MTAFAGQLALFKDDVVARCAEKAWTEMRVTLKHLEPWDALATQAQRVWTGNIERIIETQAPEKSNDQRAMLFAMKVLLETQKLLAAIFIVLQAEQGTSLVSTRSCACAAHALSLRMRHSTRPSGKPTCLLTSSWTAYVRRRGPLSRRTCSGPDSAPTWNGVSPLVAKSWRRSPPPDRSPTSRAPSCTSSLPSKTRRSDPDCQNRSVRHEQTQVRLTRETACTDSLAAGGFFP